MDGSSYKPETPLEGEIIEALKKIRNTEGRKQPTFVRIQLQFPKANRAFKKVKKVFRDLDLDQDESLSLQEINEAVKTLGGTATEKELKDLFDTADADGGGDLDFKEFVVFLCVCSLLGHLKEDDCNLNTAFDCVVNAFSVFDTPNHGIIVLSELDDAMNGAGIDVMAERMKEMDNDGDGYVTFPEFLLAFMCWVGSDDDSDDDSDEDE
mmetsp:Transcript_28127/g.33319  ORF Transcript_28127/g.33319 Transcript_28127/m.33319 type:complete len:209 (+) Transcript_28127:167-793(+)|eukprot:CAMPEP_0198258638 /NCGR_PEP_ID=MMETSP1447-20131203/8004_1 /TAXON_ID=420782 /ORGANISM="Chaetoceros dichaeta, Strain CCMP1751" /LENGTH=208 /DNA_ID=CAMNT_0043945803 /DNA_START=144 /DNA_END=770 /DNA_ORIENTATION=-